MIPAGDGYQLLAYAIVATAVNDYQHALNVTRRQNATDQRRMAAEWTVTECERFFRSTWYGTLCDIPGERIINAVKYGNTHISLGKGVYEFNGKD